MAKYLPIIIIFVICLSAFNLVLAQSSGQASLSPGKESIAGQGSGFLKNSLDKIFLVWKSFQDKFVTWWQENILPRFKEWYEAKKAEVLEELAKEKQEFKEEARESFTRIFSAMWQEVKSLFK